jgi:hypothetical protein
MVKEFLTYVFEWWEKPLSLSWCGFSWVSLGTSTFTFSIILPDITECAEKLKQAPSLCIGYLRHKTVSALFLAIQRRKLKILLPYLAT